MAVSSDPAEIVAMGFDAFADAVGAELARWGGQRRNLPHPAGDLGRRAGARAGWSGNAPRRWSGPRYALGDWRRALDQLDDVETRMLAVLDALGLTELVTTIDGLSAVGAAAILAEAGDPARFDCARTWVKHAGLCPRANESGTFAGTTKVSGRGRPGAAHRRLARGLGRAAPQQVYAARYPTYHPRRQPPQRRTGPRRHRRRAAAPAVRRRHPARRLGPGHRRRHSEGVAPQAAWRDTGGGRGEPDSPLGRTRF